MQAKKAEVEGYGKKLEEMKGVATLQKEVADLDRCIAWSEALDLRVEVQQLTAAIEEQLPKEVDEVSAAPEGNRPLNATRSHHCICHSKVHSGKISRCSTSLPHAVPSGCMTQAFCCLLTVEAEGG